VGAHAALAAGNGGSGMSFDRDNLSTDFQSRIAYLTVTTDEKQAHATARAVAEDRLSQVG